MRKLLVAFLFLTALSAFAQDEDWRNRPAPPEPPPPAPQPAPYDIRRHTPSPHAFELTPFVGYRWAGTIFADQTFVFGEDVEVAPSSDFGIAFGIPLGPTGMKLELMANRQSSELETGGGLFEPNDEVADIDVTYLHAGLQIPFAPSPYAVPFVVVSAGMTNLDPQISGLSAEQRFSSSFGIGVKVPMNRVVSFRFEGRGYFTFLDSYDDDCFSCDYHYNDNFYQGEVNAGLVFSF